MFKYVIWRISFQKIVKWIKSYTFGNKLIKLLKNSTKTLKQKLKLN